MTKKKISVNEKKANIILLTRLHALADSDMRFADLPINLKRLSISTAANALKIPTDSLLIMAHDKGNSSEMDPLPPLGDNQTSFLSRYNELRKKMQANSPAEQIYVNKIALALLRASIASRNLQEILSPEQLEIVHEEKAVSSTGHLIFRLAKPN